MRYVFPMLVLALSVVIIQVSGQGIVTDKSVLSFGKERSVRASIPFSTSPGTSELTASAPVLWEQPTVGNYYAAVTTGAIVENQLLTGDLLAAYGCQTTIRYEAPNHPYVVQSINAGGTVQVGGTVCGTKTQIFAELTFGRPRLTIACNSPSGKVTPGVPTMFSIPIPATFTGASAIRIDFGVSVSTTVGTTQILTLPITGPVVLVTATYPPDYTASAVVRAVLTTGGFLEASPTFLDGGGLQCDGATISGVGSFATELNSQEGRGSVTITMAVNQTQVRRNGRVTFTYTVMNPSAFPVSDAFIWDSQLGEIATILTLGPGQTVVRSVDNTLTSTTKNFAMVTATDPFGNTLSDKTDKQTVEVIDPAVSMNLWIAPMESKRGKDVTLHYDVKNTGDTPLGNISVTDNDGNVGTIASLEPGASSSLTRVLQLPSTAGNPFRVTANADATVTADPGGGNVTAEDNEGITIVESNIKLVCSVKPDKVKSGKKATYTYVVTNTGTTELNADLSDDGFGGLIESMRNLAPSENRTVTRDETITTNTTHRPSVVGVDPWSDQSVATCGVLSVTVMNPNVRISVKANGAPSSVSVSKGDKVTFSFTVENTGDCDLTNVKVVFEGSTIHTFDVLKARSSQSAPSTDMTVDQSAIFSANCVASDPDRDIVTSSDKVEVKVSDGLLNSLLDKALGNARSGMNQMIICSTKVVSVKNEFIARLKELRAAGTDPCPDTRLRALRVEAKSLLQCVKDKRDEVIKSYGNDIKTAAEVIAKKINVDDIVEFLFTAGGQVSDTEQRVQDMEGEWSAAHCDAALSSVTINGKVVDENGNPLPGATVIVNGITVSTNAAGAYTAVVQVAIGSTIKVSASGLDTKGKSHGASTSITFNGEASSDAGTITIKGIKRAAPKMVKSVQISPTNPTVAVGSTIAFTLTAIFDDESKEDVTAVTTWTGGSTNSFTAEKPGTASMTAEYAGTSQSVQITVECPKGKDWNDKLGKCIDLNSAIDSTAGTDKPCLDKEINQNLTALKGLVGEMSNITYEFEAKHLAFMRIFNLKNSNPCTNSALAAAFIGCENDFLNTDNVVEQAEEAASNALLLIGLCPNDVVMDITLFKLPPVGFITQALQEIGSQRGAMRNKLTNMKSLLSSQGCDTTEVRNLGNTIAGNGGNPIIPVEGGDGAQEICGDGVDNDGDGLIDEGCSQQSNANVTIYLFDSGKAKDDVFNLALSSHGDLGNTPEGGARTYPLTLGAGSYVATVTVIKAPDDVGTFTLSVALGSTVIASQIGSPGVGARVTVPFTIKVDKLIGTPDSSAPTIDFDRITHQENVKKER